MEAKPCPYSMLNLIKYLISKPFLYSLREVHILHLELEETMQDLTLNLQ